MKKCQILLATVMLLVCCTSPVLAVDESQIVNSFKLFSQETMAKVIASYEGVHYKVAYIDAGKYSAGRWLKISAAVDPHYKIDVQKTNSLISPYIATLEVNYQTTFYKSFPTEAAAESTNSVDRYSQDIFKFTVAYQEGNWVVTEAKSYRIFEGKWYNRDTKDIYEELRCKYPAH